MTQTQTDVGATRPAGAKPIVKWAGGKSWLVTTLGPVVHAALRGGRYIEPFLGGGAMALYLGAPRMLLGDVCAPLIEMYGELSRRPAAFCRALDLLAAEYAGTEDGYYRLRAAEIAVPVIRAAKLVYLNKFGFNGLYRENKRGEFNVPWGGDRLKGRPARDLLPSIEDVHAVAHALADASLDTLDFEELVAEADAGDIIYADPPYHGGSFAAYTAARFEEPEQIRLAAALWEAHERGAAVFTTNADTNFVRKQYEWAALKPTQERRNINSNGEGRGETSCLLITNRPEWIE